jgi:hypothetical protein
MDVTDVDGDCLKLRDKDISSGSLLDTFGVSQV